jgi:hypothetical protein
VEPVKYQCNINQGQLFKIDVAIAQVTLYNQADELLIWKGTEMIDSQGRLFKKFSVLDLGALMVILMVLAGIFLVPGTGVAQTGVEQKRLEVDVIVKGLNLEDPALLITQFKTEKKTNIIIRNQPYGQVEIQKVSERARLLAVPQPDGSVKAMPDPRPDLSTDLSMTLAGNADVKDGEVVFGNNKIKIGTTLELEGKTYNFNCSVVGIRIK